MTKEKRMRMKIEKKNLRRKNEMKRKKNLKISLPTKSSSVKYSPIKFDKFGSVCRYVNHIDSVSPNDTEMFGCEIVRDLPDYIRDFIKSIGLGEVIRVPKSNYEGLTGSGESRECHKNSTMLSLSIFGKNGRRGNRLCGYVVDEGEPFDWNGKTISNTKLTPHSVWNTPEGKTRCVTDYGSRHKEILFLPIGLNSVEEEFCKEPKHIRIFDNKSLDITGMDTEERMEMEDLVELIERNGNNILYEETFDMSISNKDVYWKREIENSHFGKVSLFTGRSWDYFKNKILNTYYPTSTTTKTPKIVI